MVNFNPKDYDYIVRWQSDLENTTERPLHKPSQDQSKSTAMGWVWDFEEQCILRKRKSRQIAASVLLKLFINGYEGCHHWCHPAHARNSFKYLQQTGHDPRRPENYNYTMNFLTYQKCIRRRWQSFKLVLHVYITEHVMNN